MPQPLSPALIEACLHQADASLVLESLARHLQAALPCQSVAFFAQQGESNGLLDALPLFWSDTAAEQSTSLHEGLQPLLSLAALQARAQHTLYRQPLPAQAQPGQDAEGKAGELLALPLYTAGNLV